jgi:hypothetical protein
MASLPQSARRTSLAELCHRPGSSASTICQPEVVQEGQGRVKDQPRPIRQGSSACRQTSPAQTRPSRTLACFASRSAAPVAAVVASSPHPAQGDEVSTRMSKHRSRLRRRSERPGRTCRRAPPAPRRWGGPLAHCTAEVRGATPDLPAAPDATTLSELQVEGQLDLGLGRRRHIARDHLSACALIAT